MGKLTTEQIQEYDNKYLLHTWGVQSNKPRTVIEKAEGIYLYDSTGKKYYDMTSQAVNVNIGHGNKKLIAAIKAEMDNLPALGPSFATETRSLLAKRILGLVSDKMGKVFFTLAGADANENAIKIARMYTRKPKIFTRYRSYHGSTSGAGNLTGEPRRFANEIAGSFGYIKFFDPYIYHETIPFESEEAASAYYVSKLKEQIIYEGVESVAAVMCETITGSNGVIIPPKGYLKGVRQVCDELGILMICDEVMAGFGRTGKYFAFQNFGIEPDIITFAKGITCGYVPLGGVIVNKKIAEYFNTHVLSCGLTYASHSVGCAAGNAMLDIYEQDHVMEHVQEVGKVLGEILEDLKAKHKCIGDVRYIGLFSAIELVKNRKTKEPIVPYGKDPEKIMPNIIGKLKEKGFYCYGHENNILVAPPLIIKEEELREAMKIMDEVLDYVDTIVD
ncbi:MAG: aminotransferase class III-fold pyridoxal phosphate-dependent enzyme [Clostridia bacterium]|jgi:taurine--2-oxoglutarate transaminase|nr:aminotransferase class III-fold pyridoxal phosphate-dependent enzyme [Clostridia bacterium]MCI2000651.1 aminotransferase class III-fold pyridoxal phosphate-dependent enzyme [Clostridia bacterium]MCI2015276.1 aminotransferase class III-fold pyridoxal phosphate-dependent enzyme [Clostridia bacterium]